VESAPDPAPTTTTCCIVGGGPAGMVLGLLLARAGVQTTVLEEHADFHREFRGDTLHPSTMELMDQLGLAERLLELRHTIVRDLSIRTPAGSFTLVDFGWYPTRYPYITMMPQSDFLQFLAEEASRYPAFKLVLGAPVQALVEEDGVVRGVRYRSKDGWHEVRALLTVGADGRFSRVRHLAGLEPIKTSAPMDVLWFRLSRRPDDPDQALGQFGGGRILVVLNRFDYWQIGYVIPKGEYQRIHGAGLEAFRAELKTGLPALADRVDELTGWRQISLLSVESSRLARWYRSGLLLIGDAAHVMTPVGGVGINVAIQDAVATANLLVEPLRAGRLRLSHLAAVQRQRELPVRVIQTFQSLLQNRVLAPSLRGASFRVPLVMRARPLRYFIGRLIGFGLWPVRATT
jgi:2-polyprenyl-6-methoxyphenol hydroxylase-like FAD-dependent oxidoreductase